MPGATSRDYILSKEGIESAGKQIKDRRSMIQSNRQYYRGDMPKPLKDEKDNIIINLCSDVVDQTVAFLLPEMPTLALDESRDTSDDEQWLRQMWSANGGATLLQEAATNGALAGQVYMRVLLPDMDDTEHEYPQLIVINPANIVTWWRQDNYKRLFGYEMRWDAESSDNGVSMRQQKEHRQVTLKDGDRWLIRDFIGSDDRWQQTDEMVWNYPLPPIIDSVHLPQTNSYYGKSELTHKFLNDAVNAVASDMKSILRWHAFPTMFGKGFTADSLQPTAVDGLFTVENTDADLKTVEMMSDLTSSMNMLMKLEGLFYRQARVVTLPNDLSMFRGVTNLGIRSAFMPMLAKNETLRRSYGTLIDRVSRVAMMLAGKGVAEDNRVMVEWGSALPSDEVAEVDLIAREMGMGIMSKREASRLRGRDYDVITRDLMEESMMDGIRDRGAPVGVSG